MKTLLLIAILFATTILVTGAQSFAPSFTFIASAQNEEVVEVEEEGEVEEFDEEEQEPNEEEQQPEEESDQ